MDFLERMGITFTWRFDWFSGGGDKCVVCQTERRSHQFRDHKFVEEE